MKRILWKMANSLTAVALFVAVSSAASASWAWFYQPEEPGELRGDSSIHETINPDYPG